MELEVATEEVNDEQEILASVLERSRCFLCIASEAIIALARELLPEADLRVGDMESLPHGDATFDLVTGFTSFFFANDMVGALREAGRVANPRASVAIQVWGARERSSLDAMKEIARPFMPPRPPDAPPDPDLSQPGMLEA